MLSINFDIPTYLRVSHGMATVSSRLDHLLPEAPTPQQPAEAPPSERVVINRVFNPRRLIPKEEKVGASPSTEVPAYQSQPKVADELPELDDTSHEESAVKAISDTELSFSGKNGQPVTGIYLGSGHAPYRFNKGNSTSYFLRIDKGLIWGIELKNALKEAGASKGDRVQVTYLGKVPVKVLVRPKGGKRNQGDVWETRHRNQWSIQVLSD
jgi:hypothetical protein